MTLPPPTLLVNGAPADLSVVPAPITITHGRSRPEYQPDAPVMTFEWMAPDTCPQVGDNVALIMNLPDDAPPPLWDDPRVRYDDPRVTYDGRWVTTVPRFHGIVADVDMQEAYPGPGAARLVAVSGQADLGRTMVLLDRPAETDTARVAAICAAAGVPVTITGTPGPQLAADVIDRDALAALWEVCESSAGVLWTDGAGQLHYGTGDHRAHGVPTVVLPAHAVPDGIQWQSTEGDLINRVTVTWGPQDAQQQHTISDDQSIARYGRHDTAAATLLADQTAADQLAALILARRAWPFWRLSDVVVDSAYTDDVAAVVAAAHAAVSDAALIPVPAAPGPVGQPAEWIVEGWTEFWAAPDRVVFQFAVTDRARFALTVLRSWSDAAQATWADELDGSWLDALIKEPA